MPSITIIQCQILNLCVLAVKNKDLTLALLFKPVPRTVFGEG